MFKLSLITLILSLWFPLFDTLEESRYVKTEVYLEPESCENTKYNHHLATLQPMTEIYCPLFCSQHPECRRVMVDKTTKECRLYQSGENCFSTNITDKVCFRQTSLCSGSKCTRCPIGYYGDICENIIQDCTDSHQLFFDKTQREYQLSYIRPKANGDIVEARCNFEYGITVIQNREMRCNEVNFNRSWAEYASGFGKPYADYWLGLQHIYDILQNHPNFLLAVKLGLDNKEYQSYYNKFIITDAGDGFRYNSNPYDEAGLLHPTGDSMTNAASDIRGRRFSTYDNDSSGHHCVNRFHGGWWYLSSVECSLANLNGERNGSTFESTIHWLNDKGSRTDFDYVLMWMQRN